MQDRAEEHRCFLGGFESALPLCKPRGNLGQLVGTRAMISMAEGIKQPLHFDVAVAQAVAKVTTMSDFFDRASAAAVRPIEQAQSEDECEAAFHGELPLAVSVPPFMVGRGWPMLH